MSFLNIFKNETAIGASNYGFAPIFALDVRAKDFTENDIKATYSKILTDTFRRTHGLKKEHFALLWDSCVASDTNMGLITLLVEAMYRKGELFLVYANDVEVLRLATQDEREQIIKDYKERGESPVGVYISFKNYRRTDMLRIYSSMEYCVLASFNKLVNLAKALQIKISQLRKSVALTDASIARDQAGGISKALGEGMDIYCDKDDDIVTATVDVGPTEKAIAFLDAKRAFYLGLPQSYISGLQTPGIGSTGEQDMRAVEDGLQSQYFFSIVKPVSKALFGVDVEFKSKDFRQMGSALEALRSFSLDDSGIISMHTKRNILSRMLDFDLKEEEKFLKEEEREAEKAFDDQTTATTSAAV